MPKNMSLNFKIEINNDELSIIKENDCLGKITINKLKIILHNDDFIILKVSINEIVIIALRALNDDECIILKGVLDKISGFPSSAAPFSA